VTVLWDYFHAHQSDIISWLLTTIWLAAVPVVAGLIIALPIGWVCARYRWTYPPITSAAGILYTIPSLVLFLVLPGILGTRILDAINVAVALTIYTIALLVRVVADGLISVSTDTLAAASAMGYTGRQRLFAVQLPIAIPVIGAGVRVAAVSNVSLVSVASIIGVTQLGQLFIEGNNLNSIPPILVGLILFFLLALVFDLLILLIIRLLTPWQRVAAAR
jgi:osmoprotectant transport system permease protein